MTEYDAAALTLPKSKSRAWMLPAVVASMAGEGNRKTGEEQWKAGARPGVR